MCKRTLKKSTAYLRLGLTLGPNKWLERCGRPLRFASIFDEIPLRNFNSTLLVGQVFNSTLLVGQVSTLLVGQVSGLTSYL